MGEVYYDDKKQKYVHDDGQGNLTEYPENPGTMDMVKESFLPDDTRIQLDLARKQRQGKT